MANTFLFLTGNIGFAPIINKVLKERTNVLVEGVFFRGYNPDIIIADSNVKYGMLGNTLIPVVGASHFGYQLDTSPEYKTRLLKTCGLAQTASSAGTNVCCEGWYSEGKCTFVIHSFFNTSFVGSLEDKLFKQGLGKLSKVMSKLKYTGPLHMNVFINDDKLYVKDLLAEINPITMLSLLENYRGRVTSFFMGLARGETPQFKSLWHMALQLYAEPVMFPNFELKGINKHNLRHLWFYDVKQKGEDYALGDSCNLGLITSRGDTARECCRRAYRTVNNLEFNNKAYGRRWGTTLDENYIYLAENSWIKGGDLDGYKKMVYQQNDASGNTHNSNNSLHGS